VNEVDGTILQWRTTLYGWVLFFPPSSGNTLLNSLEEGQIVTKKYDGTQSRLHGDQFLSALPSTTTPSPITAGDRGGEELSKTLIQLREKRSNPG